MRLRGQAYLLRVTFFLPAGFAELFFVCALEVRAFAEAVFNTAFFESFLARVLVAFGFAAEVNRFTGADSAISREFAPAIPPTTAPTAAPIGPINDPAAAPAAAPPAIFRPETPFDLLFVFATNRSLEWNSMNSQNGPCQVPFASNRFECRVDCYHKRNAQRKRCTAKTNYRSATWRRAPHGLLDWPSQDLFLRRT